MAEESAAAVLDAPASPTADSSPSADVAAPVVVESPSAPQVETPPTPVPQRSIEPDPTPTRQQRQPEPVVPETPPAPLEDARDANDTLLNWRDLADPEFRNHPTLQKYKSVNEALKAVVNQEELLGRSITIPKPGASDTQWRTIFEKLGCPKTASDYAITDPDMGKDADGNAKGLAPNFLVSLLDVAHTAGLTNKQAQEFVNFAARTVVQSENIQAGEMAMQKAQAERQLFEAFAGDAATMIQKATMAISRLGEGRYGGGSYSQRAAEKLRSSSLGNDVDVIAAFSNLWDNMSEGQFIEGPAGSLSSKDQIQADLVASDSIMNDDTKPIAERNQAAARSFQLRHDLVALEEAAERRATGFGGRRA